MKFDGETFEPEKDEVRLTAQYKRAFAVMQDSKFHTLSELERLIGAPQASISARLRDMRKERFGGHTVNRRRVDGGLYEYQLIENKGVK